MLALLVRAAVLLVCSTVLGLVVNALRPDGVRASAFAPPTQCAEEAGPPEELSPADAAQLCGRPDVVIADARPAARYAEGHVAGAIHLPCGADGRAAEDALNRLGTAHTVVVYGERTDDAQPVAAGLKRRAAAARVAVLRGGFTAWNEAGMACASGPAE
jgi:rhodanese-related sulfurtransferase